MVVFSEQRGRVRAGLVCPSLHVLSWLGLLLLLIPACRATVTPPPPVFLEAGGSTSMEPLLTNLSAAYNTQHPHITIDISGGGSQLGHALVEAGQIEIGLVSWPPQNLADHLRLVPIGRDAIAIILHPQNPAVELSMVELREIFSGRVLDWQRVGGPASPIQVVSREDGSGTRAAFEALVMAELAVTPTAIVMPNSQAVVDFVAQTSNAIAYVSFTFTARHHVSVASIEGISPSLESLNAGAYPLVRDLAVIVPKQSRAEVDDFVNFILSPAGQQLVGERWGRVR